MRKLLGGILLAIGILIAGASGLLTLSFLVSGGIRHPGYSERWSDTLVAAVIFGGIPFAIGLGLFVYGGCLIRRS